MSDGLLEGMVALVVGGSTGIGRGVVERYLAEGASVAVLDIDPGPLDPLVVDHASSIITVAGDASQPSASASLVTAALDAFGAIDTLVCCAGRFDFHVPIGTLSPEELASGFDEIFAINVKSMVLAVRSAMDSLRHRQGSVILTLSSSAFHPEGAGVLYGTSKWATRGLVTHLARELAPDVRVNGVAPGGTARTSLSGLASLGEVRRVEDLPGRTERLAAGNLLGRAATPEDQAGPYVFLAAKALSTFVNGAVVNSDGGRGTPISPPARSTDTTGSTDDSDHSPLDATASDTPRTSVASSSAIGAQTRKGIHAGHS